jgi:hypothetical protein
MSIPRAFVFGGNRADPDIEELPRHGIPVFVVPEAAHGMMWDNPDGFAEALQAAIAACEAI